VQGGSRWWLTGIFTGLALVDHAVTPPRRFPVLVSQAAQRQDKGVPERKKAESGGDNTPLSRWPKVQIRDPVTRDATRRALDGADRWLSAASCERLFTEFSDQAGVSLRERLDRLQSSPRGYLALVFFHDGALHATCQRHGILAFTAVGSRVVHVCGRDFARAWTRDSREAQATLIHEMLHSLGLGENPPSPRHISSRVKNLCWQ
jgi:hypothetical protein